MLGYVYESYFPRTRDGPNFPHVLAAGVGRTSKSVRFGRGCEEQALQGKNGFLELW
jgi:hypothetical protein